MLGRIPPIAPLAAREKARDAADSLGRFAEKSSELLQSKDFLTGISEVGSVVGQYSRNERISTHSDRMGNALAIYAYPAHALAYFFKDPVIRIVYPFFGWDLPTYLTRKPDETPLLERIHSAVDHVSSFAWGLAAARDEFEMPKVELLAEKWSKVPVIGQIGLAHICDAFTVASSSMSLAEYATQKESLDSVDWIYVVSSGLQIAKVSVGYLLAPRLRPIIGAASAALNLFAAIIEKYRACSDVSGDGQDKDPNAIKELKYVSAANEAGILAVKAIGGAHKETTNYAIGKSLKPFSFTAGVLKNIGKVLRKKERGEKVLEGNAAIRAQARDIALLAASVLALSIQVIGLAIPLGTVIISASYLIVGVAGILDAMEQHNMTSKQALLSIWGSVVATATLVHASAGAWLLDKHDFILCADDLYGQTVNATQVSA